MPNKTRWRLLIIGIGLCLAMPAKATPDARIDAWRVCEGPPSATLSNCRAVSLRDVDPQDGLVWVTAQVEVERPTGAPLAVFVSAYAASAAYWDGEPIGANGLPSASKRGERPGRRDAAIPIPASAPGRHTLTLALSSHHGLWRLRSPITDVRVDRFEPTSSGLLRGYLSALMSLGGLALLTALLVLQHVRRGGRAGAGSPELLAAALFVAGQLAAEVSRAFVEPPYPLLFVRIGLVLVCAGGFGAMLVLHLTRHLGLGPRGPALAAYAALAGAAAILTPSFDRKTALVLTSSAMVSALIALLSWRRSGRRTPVLTGLLGLGAILSLTTPYSFLDRDLYPWATMLLALLMMRAAASPVETTAKTLAPVGAAAIAVGSHGARRYVRPCDIIRLAAADDYTEVILADARAVLHPEPLHRLLERLPPDFLRVHRSHAVNLAHLRAFNKGRVSTVVLTDNSTAPVSRRSVSRLVAALEGNPPRPERPMTAIA